MVNAKIAPTRLKWYNHNLYAIAAVATALQMSMDSEAETAVKAVPFGYNQVICDDEVKDLIKGNSIAPVSTAMVSFNSQSVQMLSNASTVGNEVDDDLVSDFAVKPKYIREFKIRVGKLKLDRSLPKIFVD